MLLCFIPDGSVQEWLQQIRALLSQWNATQTMLEYETTFVSIISTWQWTLFVKVQTLN